MTGTITTVSAGFRELLSRIELNPARVALASQRYNAVSGRITATLPGKNVQQVGSFQRKTKIRPLDDANSLDIDAIVCFGDAHTYSNDGSGTTPSDALGMVRRALELDKTYKIMDPSIDSPTVVLEYSDGFKIELVPCFREKTGRYPRLFGPACYIVGSANGDWIPADYDYDAEFISGMNHLETIKQSLVPSIKMIKAFLRAKEMPLKSFHVEILCANLIPQKLTEWNGQNRVWGYQHILAFFLSTAHSLLSGPIRIPNSYSTPVDSGLSSWDLQQIGQAIKKYGELAWAVCGLQNEARALGCWRQFFGDLFPA